MGDEYCVLAIKPEFLQTRVGLYNQDSLVFLKTIIHSESDLSQFKQNTDQYRFRSEAVLVELQKAGIDLQCIKIIMARGGLLKSIPSGIYKVNEAMMRDLRQSPVGVHSVNIGGLMADYITTLIPGSEAFIADPAVVDELDEIARYTGFPQIQRKSVFHALNHRYVARKYAQAIGKPYEELNLIVAHLGDGISVGAHKNGKVVDVNQCFDGEGPFSLERAGSIPMVDLVKLCFSGKYSEQQILTMIRNEGGVFAYLGTSDYQQLEKAMKENNLSVVKIFEAMAYQVSKYIGYMAPVFLAPVDAILLTGNLSHNSWFSNIISSRVKFIAPVHTYPGEDVLDALAMNGFLIIKGEADICEYF